MSKTFELYEERFKPYDLKCRSGFTWRVRKMQTEDWGVVAGGFILLPQDRKDGAPSEEDERARRIDQQAKYRKAVYEQLVVGLLDVETGELIVDGEGKPVKLPYEKVLAADITEICDWQISGAPQASEAAAAAGRSLR